MSHKLLREYIREIIKEEYDDGGWGGVEFGSQKDLYNVFVKPFTDVVHTAAAETKKISQRTQGLLKITIASIVTTLIPAYRSRYDKIFAQQESEIEKIKAQYKDVYDATYTAFKDKDVVISAFLYAPALFLTTKTALNMPKVTIDLMNVLAGGSLDSFAEKIHNALKFGDEKKPLDRDSGPGMWESVLKESPTNQKVSKALQQKKLRQVVNNSQKTQEIQSKMKTIINGTLKKTYESAKELSNITSIEQVQKLTGKQIKGIEQLKQLNQQERKIAAGELAKATREIVKKYYVKSLTSTVKEVMKAGFEKDHPFVQAYLKTISQINSL